MSAVPVLGRAVQAPIVSVPRSVPLVAVIQVMPTPTTAARHKVSKLININRTGESSASQPVMPSAQFLRGADVAARSGVAAAKLSGKASALDDVGLSGGSSDDALTAVLAASSSSFSTCTSTSAPRRVRTGGGPGLISAAFGAPAAAIVAGLAGSGNFCPMPMPGISLISTP